MSRRSNIRAPRTWVARTAGLASVVLPALAVFLPCRSLYAQYVISTVAGGAPQATPVPALKASFGTPLAVATDATGNVYFTAQNCVYKMDRSGTLFLIAGNSRPGYSGDGGPAVEAQLYGPAGVAVDGAGNVYIADTLNNSIREVTPDGTISTIAGAGTSGSFGDGGPATQSFLYHPTGLAVDSSGNLYIADSYNNKIRKISAGVINTLAGFGGFGFSGDGSAATASELAHPNGIAVDSAGNVYVADTENVRVRRIDTSGNIGTLAGNGTDGYTGDGGPAANAEVFPYSLASDASGNVYIADLHNSRIRKVSGTTSVTIVTVAGNGTYGYTGDGGKATSAEIAVYGVALDGAGDIFLVDSANNRIREVSSSGTITTVAGSGALQYSGDGAAAIDAQLQFPTAVAVDAAGDFFIADTLNNAIREVTPDGTIATVAGNGSVGYSGDAGPATSAQLNQPGGVAVDLAGNLYIADSGNASVRIVTPNGTIWTLAGNGVPGYAGDGGPATSAQLTQPNGLAMDKAGNLYIADSNSNAVRKISAADGTITTVAGNGLPRFSGDGGPAGAAQLNHPISVAVDAAGNLFIADTLNDRVREVSANGTITTVAGNGQFGYIGDGGPATAAELDLPTGLAVDATGKLFIVDSANSVIRTVFPSGIIETTAGTGSPGFGNDGGPATSAQLNQPDSIAINAAGNIYVADAGNNAIRLLAPSTGTAAKRAPAPARLRF